MSLRSAQLRRSTLAAAAALILSLAYAACGGSSSSTTPPAISVAVSPASQSLDQGKTLSLSAVVSNDSSNKGVTWAVSGGGTLSNQTATGATYTAPASVTAVTHVTVTATSVASTSASASAAITVNPNPAITTTSLAAATVGVAYSATLAATGGSGAITWSVSAGTLPTWATLNDTTGILSGTPTAPGTASFSVVATDATSVATAAQALTLTANPAPLKIGSTALAAGTEGTTYNASLQASGGVTPYTWSVSSGSLPAWASLNASTGAITGTPNASGSTSFTVQVTDSQATPATATQALTLTVNPPAALTVATTSLTAATVGQSYSTNLQASGGLGPYTWTVSSGSLPSWASLSASGAITGTPAASGSATFTVQVTDSQATPATATQQLTLTANSPAALAVTTTTLSGATVGTTYNATLQATGGVKPYTWSISSGSLPAWASLNASTGAITGTPTAAASTTFTAQVQDSEATPATATQALTLTAVAAGPNDSELKGQYAVLLQDASVPEALVGSFTADGAGNITGGELDFESAALALNADAISSGSYSIGSDNRGTLSISDKSGHSFSFSVALGSISGGVSNWGGITEDDGVHMLSGRMDLQTASAFSTSAVGGGYGYAFQVSGDGGQFAEVGSFTALSGAISSGLEDQNQSGTVQTQVAFTGSMGAFDANGRSAVTTTPSGQYALYAVSVGRLDLIVTGTNGASAVAGVALLQAGAPFSASSLSGNAILWTQGWTGVPSPHASLGILNFDGAGNLTGVTDTNDGGTISLDQSITGATYTVTSASAGRVTVTTGAKEQIVYLVGQNSAFTMGTGAAPDISRIVPQSGSNFTDATVKGTFALATLPIMAVPVSPTTTSPVTFSTGVVTLDGSGNVSVTLDSVRPGGVVTGGKTSTDTYATASNGRITTGSGSVVLYAVSPTRLILLQIQNNNPNPTIEDLRQ